MGMWNPHLHPRDFRGRFKDGSLTYEVKPYPGEKEPVHAWEYAERGRVVSGLYADLDTGQILHVETMHDQQGQGLASGLYREAADKVEVFHSPERHRTEAGEAFARSVGGPTIREDRAHRPDWESDADPGVGRVVHDPPPRAPRGGSPPSRAWLEGSLAKVSDDEREALTTYSTRRYQEINGALRGQLPMTDEVSELVDRIDAGLRRNPLSGPVVLRRSSTPGEYGHEHPWEVPDALFEVLRNPAYTSSSVDWEWPDRPLQLRLHVPAGVGLFASYIAPISRYPEQREVLLERNLRRRLDDISYNRRRGLWVGDVTVWREQ